MANTTTSPNMNLPVPVPGVDPGPDWAQNIVACLGSTGGGIDGHDHSAGKGASITPAGLNINAALSFNGNSAISLGSSVYSAQNSALVTLLATYVVGADLYYTDGAGNQIRITSGGSVAGSTGTITGLPSGTASASFSAGQFSFLRSTNTPAAIYGGPLIIGRNAASPYTVSISASGSQASNYAMTLPTALPVATGPLTVDSSGNQAVATTTGTGNYVLSDSPAFTGVPTGAITSGSFTPTVNTALGSGVSITHATYTLIGNVATFAGHITGTCDGSGTLSVTLTIPVTVSTNFSLSSQLNGTLAFEIAAAAPTSAYVYAVGSSKLCGLFYQSSPSSALTGAFLAQYLVY